MATTQEKLARSLTAESTDLIPFLPYLLQDLWELGSSPRDMIDMALKHINLSTKTRVLDLACGKGAVSVQFSNALGCKVKGIDLMPEFIHFAQEKAQQHGVEDLCQFLVGDIHQAVETERNYDIVILGAVGDVLGSPEETVLKLKRTVKNHGFIFIDDAYAENNCDARYLTRDTWLAIFQRAGVKLVAEKQIDRDELSSLNTGQQIHIAKRASELKKAHPDKASLFDGYLKSQQAECDELENQLSVVTMLLQAAPASSIR